MRTSAIILLIVGVGALLAASASAYAAAATTPALIAGPEDAAVAYANALAQNNTPRAWQLLSAASQKTMDADQWKAANEQRTPPAKPRPESLVSALAAGPEPPVVVKQLVRNGEAYLQVSSVVPITQQIVMVKESSGWKVDLAATDAINARAAGENFLLLAREETLARQGKAVRTTNSSQAILRSLLAPQAKNYAAVETKADGAARATVTVSEDVPVNLVIKATRLGPGWWVNIGSPLAPNLDAFSANPLEAAAEQGERQECETQLSQVYKAMQMYASSSDNMLPDPARWLDQISANLLSATLHCPKDPGAGISYAMNKNLTGKRFREVANPSNVPLLFESTAHRRNAADTGESWPAKAWHADGVLVLFLDGSVRTVETKPSFEVKQAPPGTIAPYPARPGGIPPGMGPGGSGAGPRPQRPMLRPGNPPARPQ